MPTPHYRVRRQTRKAGRTAARMKMYAERGGYYKSRADDVLASGRSGPDLGDWREVDAAEWRCDAVVCRTRIAALPYQLSIEGMTRACQKHADWHREIFGTGETFHVHRPSGKRGGDPRAFHVHFTGTTREVDAAGNIGAKVRRLDRAHTVYMARAHWQDCVNAELRREGHSVRLDLRSFQKQGRADEPLRPVPRIEFEEHRRGEKFSHHYAYNQAELSRRSGVARRRSGESRAARARRVGVLDAGAKILGRVADRRGRYGTVVRGGMVRLEGVQTHPVAEGIVEDQQPRAARDAGADRDARMAAGIDAPGRVLRAGRTDADPALAAGARDVGMGRAARNELTPAATGAADVGQPGSGHGARRSRGQEAGRMAAASGPVFARGGSPAGRGTDDGQDGRGEGGRRSNATDPGAAARPPSSRADAGRGPRGIRRPDAGVTSPAPVVRITTTTGGIFFARAYDVQAARRIGGVNVPLCQEDGSPVAPGGRTRLRLTSIADVQPVAHEQPAQAQVTDLGAGLARVQESAATPTPAAPPRSLMARVGRWISGADRREREAQAQAEADRRHEQAVASMRELNARIAERERRAAEQERANFAAAHERAAREKAERAEAWRARVAAGIEAVAVSDEPLVQIRTEAGYTYHMRRGDWLDALDTGAADVPLCSEYGHDVPPGYWAQMAVAKVAQSVLEPIPLPTAEQYQIDMQQAQVEAQERGHSHGI